MLKRPNLDTWTNTFLNGFNQKRTYIQRIQRTFQILLQDHIHTLFKKTVIIVHCLLHLDTWTNAKASLLLGGIAKLKYMLKMHAESWDTFQGATTRLNTVLVWLYLLLHFNDSRTYTSILIGKKFVSMSGIALHVQLDTKNFKFHHMLLEREQITYKNSTPSKNTDTYIQDCLSERCHFKEFCFYLQAERLQQDFLWKH